MNTLERAFVIASAESLKGTSWGSWEGPVRPTAYRYELTFETAAAVWDGSVDLCEFVSEIRTHVNALEMLNSTTESAFLEAYSAGDVSLRMEGLESFPDGEDTDPSDVYSRLLSLSWQGRNAHYEYDEDALTILHAVCDQWQECAAVALLAGTYQAALDLEEEYTPRVLEVACGLVVSGWDPTDALSSAGDLIATA